MPSVSWGDRMKWTTGKFFIVIAIGLIAVIYFPPPSQTPANTGMKAMPKDHASGDTNEEVIKTLPKNSRMFKASMLPATKNRCFIEKRGHSLCQHDQ